MRAVILALAMVTLGAAPVLAQAKGAIQPTKKADIGDDFISPLFGGSTSSTSSGGGFTGFVNGLIKGDDSKRESVATPVVASSALAGIARADEANLLTITKADGSKVTVRQWGIEAPDTKQWPWGPRARGEVDRMLAANGGKVQCTTDGTMTKAGNPVARCYAGDTDISAKLIEGGYAVEWREVSGGAYTQLEANAQAKQLGVWSK